MKFIHDGQVIIVQSTRDMLSSSEPVLQISHSGDDFFADKIHIRWSIDPWDSRFLHRFRGHVIWLAS